MHNLNIRAFAWVIAGFAILVSLPCVLLNSESLSQPRFWWGHCSTLATGLIAFAFVFTKWLWKWTALQGWLVPFPNLNGIWDGQITSTWVDPTTGNRIAPIPTLLTIKQTFTKISCVMQTGEMTSRSFIGGFHVSPDDQICQLVYSYTSDPMPTVQVRSTRHYGTAMLDVLSGKPVQLNGVYWSDRKTTGELQLTFKSALRQKRHDQVIAVHPMTQTQTSNGSATP